MLNNFLKKIFEFLDDKFDILLIIFLVIVIFLLLFRASFGAEITNYSSTSTDNFMSDYNCAIHRPQNAYDNIISFIYKPSDDLVLNNLSLPSYFSGSPSPVALIFSSSSSAYSPTNDYSYGSYFLSSDFNFVSTSTSSIVSSTSTTFYFDNVYLNKNNFYYFIIYTFGGSLCFYHNSNIRLDNSVNFYPNFLFSTGVDIDLSLNFFTTYTKSYAPLYYITDIAFSLNFSYPFTSTQIIVESPTSTTYNFGFSDYKNFYKINFYLNTNDIMPFQHSFITIGYTLYRKGDDGIFRTYGLKAYRVYFNNLNVPGWNSVYLDSPYLSPGEYRVLFYLHTDSDIFLPDLDPVFFVSNNYSTSTNDNLFFYSPPPSVFDTYFITSTPSCSFFECPGDWIYYYMFQVVKNSIIPSESMSVYLKNRFIDIYNESKDVFPFGYYTKTFDYIYEKFKYASENNFSPTLTFNLFNKNINITRSDIESFLGPELTELKNKFFVYASWLLAIFSILYIIM